MSFVRQFFIYGISGAASRLAAVVLVPLYTRTLSIGDYGELELLLAIHALILIVAGMQVESAVARDYFEAKAGSSRALAWSALYLSLAGSALVALVLTALWLLGWLPAIFSGKILWLLLAMTVPAQLFGVQLVILRFAGNPIFFALVSFCDLALCALFSAFYIVVMQLGVVGALYGVLSGKLVCVALAWRRTLVDLRPRRVRKGAGSKHAAVRCSRFTGGAHRLGSKRGKSCSSRHRVDVERRRYRRSRHQSGSYLRLSHLQLPTRLGAVFDG